MLFRRFDAMLGGAGYIAMGGQIIDATVVAAPKQRQHRGREARAEGRPRAGGLAAEARELRQKDRDERWTLKHSKAPPAADGTERIDVAIPFFGYKKISASTGTMG